MTNLQLYLAIGLPIFAILTSLIVSLVQISSIRGDMRDQRADFRVDLADIKAEIKGLRADGKADMTGLRSDIQLLTGKVYEMMGKDK